MVNASLNKNMVELLKELKSARFISYECGKIYDSAYGNLRINTDRGSIELTNLQKVMPFFDDEEELSCFECKKADPCTKFKPYCAEPFEAFEVDEIITDIEIINDVITVGGDDYEISSDQAIIIKTTTKTLMFSRDVWFSEDISISENDDYNSIFPISNVIDLWSNEGDYKVMVNRTRKKL